MKEYWDQHSRKLSLIRYFRRSDFTPFPIQRAISLGTYFSDGDSIRSIRQAAHETPAIQRRPLSFRLTWKDKIDAITGGDSVIYHGFNLAKSFTLGESILGGVDELGSDLDTQPYTTRLTKPPLGTIRVNLKITPTEEQLDALVKKCAALKNIYFPIEFGIIGTFNYGAFTIGDTEIGDNNFVLGDGVDQSGEYFISLRSL
ncbi:hypothetical protein [Leptospira andrefontaineae]|nr:hypothetical protein [Leptospira andrefontaineae]